MKIYLGDVTEDKIIGLEEYNDLSKGEIEKIKKGQLGFINLSDDEDEEDHNDDYYYYFKLIKNESNLFIPNEAQKNIIVIEGDYECDAAISLAKSNGFDDYNHGYMFAEGDENPIFKCGNNIDGKELIYEYEC